LSPAAKKVIILGGLGNGSVVAAALDDAARRDGCEWEVAGYLNDRMTKGADLEGHPVLGALQDLPHYLDKEYYFVYTIYRIDGQDHRLALFESLKIPDKRLATFAHPTAYLAPNVKLSPGCIILPQVSISPGVELGRCCLVMAGATLGHNSRIGDHCHIAAQACLGAYLHVHSGVHIGLNATVRENVTLGENATLAMGAVLLNDVGPGEIWGGVPAKLLRQARREL
jgi:acetyltransferase EpsM